MQVKYRSTRQSYLSATTVFVLFLGCQFFMLRVLRVIDHEEQKSSECLKGWLIIPMYTCTWLLVVLPHRPQIAVQPRQGFLDIFAFWRDVIRLIYFEGFVFFRGSYQFEQGFG